MTRSHLKCHSKLPTDNTIFNNKFAFHSKDSKRVCDFFSSYGSSYGDMLSIAYNNSKIPNWSDCKCPLIKSIFEDMIPMTGDLERKGYFKFNTTSLLDDNVLSLHENSNPSHPSHGVLSQRINLYSFPKLQNFVDEFLTPHVRNYIGKHMVQGSTTLLKLGERNIEKSQYVSGMWHHDRCAKRVKCFIFLSDIDEESHPMRLIVPTHKQLYFDYSRLHTSRLSDEYASQHGDEVVFTGTVGDGFCFDTNGIHKGTLNGRKKRTTLITEFHNNLMKRKYEILDVHAPFGK